MKLSREDIPSIGLTVLYEPDEPASAVVDVVLIGGLGSHPVHTWTYTIKDREEAARAIKDSSGTEPLRGNITSSSTRSARSTLKKSRPRADDPENVKSPNGRKLASGSKPDIPEEPEQKQPWMHDVYWPLDLLPKACPKTRVLVWGCHSIVMNGKLLPSQNSIFAHAEDLLQELTDFRDETKTTGRAVVFVAHSLGGVIIKEALRRAETEPQAQIKDLLESTSGVIFMGSPHRATPEWKLGDAVKNMAHLTLGIDPKDPDLVELCGANARELELGRETFLRLWADHNFRVKTFQEKRVAKQRYGEPRAELRLRREASFIGDPRERADTLGGAHLDMCKFRSEYDVEWKMFADVISQHVVMEVSRLHELNMRERECLKALEQASLSPHGYHSTVSYPGTCLWLYDLPEFQDWNHCTPKGKGKVLWIEGPPGSGKTVLLRSLRQRIEKQWEASGAVFLDVVAEGRDLDKVYFPVFQGREYVPNPARVYRALLARLFHHDPKLRKQIMAIYKKHRSFDDTRVVSYFTEDYISSRVDTPAKRTFIFIDASDVCGASYLQDLLHHLSTLSQNSDFSIAVASVQHSDVRLPAARAVEVLMQNNNTNDILRYVNLNLVAEWEDRNKMANRLSEKANGVFLWAELVTNILNAAIDEGATPDLVDHTLDQIPGSLSGLYEWLLATLSPEEKQEALVLFQWVLLASEHLRLNDLRFAVRVTKTWRPEIFEPRLALELGKPEFIREMRPYEPAFDSPYQFHRWVRQRSLGLLELRPSAELPETGKGGEPLGLQRVHVVHESVRTFFIQGRGYAALVGESAASMGRFDDASHFTLLNACLTYLNMADFEPLGNASAPRGRVSPVTPGTRGIQGTGGGINIPSNPLPYEESKYWRRAVSDQRHLVISSYPFLQYAVSNILYHLLSPRVWRFFPPQQQLLTLLAADRCRLWKRWTALLGTSEPRYVMSASESAANLVGCVSGASVRLERVFRKLNELVTEEIRVFEEAEGKGAGQLRRRGKRAFNLKEVARDGAAKRKVGFLLAPQEAEIQESVVASSPASAVATGLESQTGIENPHTGHSESPTLGKAITMLRPIPTANRALPGQPQPQADETLGLSSSSSSRPYPISQPVLAADSLRPQSPLPEEEPGPRSVVGRGTRASVGMGIVSHKSSRELLSSKPRSPQSPLHNPRPSFASPKLSKSPPETRSVPDPVTVAATPDSFQTASASTTERAVTPGSKAIGPKMSREKLPPLTVPVFQSTPIMEAKLVGKALHSLQEEGEYLFSQTLDSPGEAASTSAISTAIAPLNPVPPTPRIQRPIMSSSLATASLAEEPKSPDGPDPKPWRIQKPREESYLQNRLRPSNPADSRPQPYMNTNPSPSNFSPYDYLSPAPLIPRRSAERLTLITSSEKLRGQRSADKRASEEAKFEEVRTALLSPTSPQEAKRRLIARNESKKARLPLYKRMHHHTHVRERSGGAVEPIDQLKGLGDWRKSRMEEQTTVPEAPQTKTTAALKDSPATPSSAKSPMTSPVSVVGRPAATTPAWEDITRWSPIRTRSPVAMRSLVYNKPTLPARPRSKSKPRETYMVSGANGMGDQPLRQARETEEAAAPVTAGPAPPTGGREWEKRPLRITDPFKLDRDSQIVYTEPVAMATQAATTTATKPATINTVSFVPSVRASANRDSFYTPGSANRSSFASTHRIRTPASANSERAFWSPATLLSSPLTELSETGEVVGAFDPRMAPTSTAAPGWRAYSIVDGGGSRHRRSRHLGSGGETGMAGMSE